MVIKILSVQYLGNNRKFLTPIIFLKCNNYSKTLFVIYYSYCLIKTKVNY